MIRFPQQSCPTPLVNVGVLATRELRFLIPRRGAESPRSPVLGDVQTPWAPGSHLALTSLTLHRRHLFMNGPVGIVDMALPVQAWSVNTLFDVSAPKLLLEATPGRRTGV